MKANSIEQLAEQLLRGEISREEFLRQAPATTADLGDVQIDLDRQRRCGYPEVIFGQGKTIAMLERTFQALVAREIDVLATRIDAEQAAALVDRFSRCVYNPVARTLRLDATPLTSTGGVRPRELVGFVAVVTAGSCDLPVAEEARETLDWMGVRATLICDVGVAGPHRLRERLPELAGADAVVVIAGMEGALPSVVGGYVSCPVIGVPTSVGYGANFNGLAALLSMLNSCAANVTVVNIDAGFKGGYVAGMIANGNRNRQRAAPESNLTKSISPPERSDV